MKIIALNSIKSNMVAGGGGPPEVFQRGREVGCVHDGRPGQDQGSAVGDGFIALDQELTAHWNVGNRVSSSPFCAMLFGLIVRLSGF